MDDYLFNIDIYVLVDDRSKKMVESFLEHFLPMNTEASDEYWIPQYSTSPELIISEASELMKYCEEHSSVPNTIYWDNKNDGDPWCAIVQYTTDGHCVLGLRIKDERHEKAFLTRLKDFGSSQLGYITCENPPETSKEDFLKMMSEVENFAESHRKNKDLKSD